MEIDLSTSPFPWWEWDVHANNVQFNDVKVTSLGYDPADFRHRGFQAFTSLLHPDDHAHTMASMRALLTGHADLYETLYRIRDVHGLYHWYLDRGFAIDQKGSSITRVRGLVLDLGERLNEGSDVEAVLRMMEKIQEDPGNLVTICSACKRVRMDSTSWVPVTKDFELILADRLSHGLCQECLVRLYPDMADRLIARLAESEGTPVKAS